MFTFAQNSITKLSMRRVHTKTPASVFFLLFCICKWWTLTKIWYRFNLPYAHRSRSCSQQTTIYDNEFPLRTCFYTCFVESCSECWLIPYLRNPPPPTSNRPKKHAKLIIIIWTNLMVSLRCCQTKTKNTPRRTSTYFHLDEFVRQIITLFNTV